MRVLSYAAVDCSHSGGVQSVVAGLADGLVSSGHSVDTVYSQPTDGRAGSGPVIGLHLRESAPGTEKRRWWHWPSAWRIGKVLLRARPDVVHLHFLTRRAVYFLRLRKVFGFKVILTVHGSDILRPSPDDAPYLRDALLEADAVTVVSSDLADAVRDLLDGYAIPVEVIANGVDIDAFRPTPHSADAATIVSLGRLEWVKGHDVLLRAFALLVSDHADIELVLAGDGERMQALRALAGELGIADYVRFAGAVDRGEAVDLLRKATVFVLPSRSEGQPIALIEAMACGCACIASDVGGVAELLRGAGICVPSESPGALADAIDRTLRSGPLRHELSQAARKRAEAHSAGAATARYEAIYRRVLSA